MSQARGRDGMPSVVGRPRAESVASSSSDEDEEYYPELRANVMELPPPEQIFAGMPARKVVNCYAKAGYPNVHLPWLERLEPAPRNRQPAGALDIARRAHSESSGAAGSQVLEGPLGVSATQLIAAMEGLVKSWTKEGRCARRTKLLFGDDCIQVCGEIVARLHKGKLNLADHEPLARLYPCTESGRRKFYDDVQALKRDSAVQSANVWFAKQLAGPKEAGTVSERLAHEDMSRADSSDSAPEEHRAGFRSCQRTSSKKNYPTKLNPLSPRRHPSSRAMSNSSSASRRKYKTPSCVRDSPRSSRH